MKFKVEDRPCLPAGPYTGRFVGCAHQDTSGPNWKPAIGNDGQPLPPGLIWSWEITEGPRAGEVADRMTGKSPTPASTCGAMLSALFERPVRVGEELDVDGLVGTMWRFHVEPKARGNGTCVSNRGLVRARDLETRTAATARPRTAAELPPPDDEDAGGHQDDEAEEKPRWWIRRAKGLDPEQVDYLGLLEFVRAGAKPEKDRCCPVGGSKWVTIAVAVPESREVLPIL